MSTGPDHLSHLLRGGFVEDFFNWHQWYFTSEAKLSVTYTVGQFNLHLCGVNEPHTPTTYRTLFSQTSRLLLFDCSTDRTNQRLKVDLGRGLVIGLVIKP